jgi:hypothetical protein
MDHALKVLLYEERMAINSDHLSLNRGYELTPGLPPGS